MELTYLGNRDSIGFQKLSSLVLMELEASHRQVLVGDDSSVVGKGSPGKRVGKH